MSFSSCSLVVHMRVKAFAGAAENILESASLGIMLLISIMNLLKASYFEIGEIPTGTADEVFKVKKAYQVYTIIYFHLIFYIYFFHSLNVMNSPFCHYFGYIFKIDLTLYGS